MPTEKNYWFVLFKYGDARTTERGWISCPKDEFTKAQAKKSGDRAAKKRGERQFNYFVVERTYVTDSPATFKKECAKVNLNPNLEDYI